ncbi:MAG: hypothetical protein DRP54_08765 [Spirochaetes bacterium]|nr:MAG: hypothetical protein DRP54_08765 [Spirochaetota bacterium]
MNNGGKDRRVNRVNNEEEMQKRIENLVEDLEKSEMRVDEVPEDFVEKVKSADEEKLKEIEKEYGIDDGVSIESLEKEYSDETSTGGLVGVEKSTEDEDEEMAEGEAKGEVYQDGRFEIKISEDKMSARISLYPSMGGGIPLNLTKIKKTMDEMGIVHGVNYELLEKLVKKVEEAKEPKEDVIIAKGTEPEEGEDGKIEYFFKETDDILREDDTEWIVKKRT